jgi:uncharacterized protein involved in outer membrane biogenesis
VSSRRWLLALPLLLVLIAVAGLAAVLRFVDLAPHAARYASAALAREVGLGTLRLGWHGGILLEIQDLRLASPDWGSQPEMVRIARLRAEIDPWSLIMGPLRVRHLEVERPDIVLERGPGRRGNWDFGTTRAVPVAAPDVAPAIAARARLPALLDAVLRDARVSYRTSGGEWLRITARTLTVAAADEAAPLRVQFDGAYNDVPLAADIEGDSYAALRRPVPLPMRITATMAGARLTFDGAAAAPLDFDGARGRVALETADLGAFLAALDADGLPAGLALHVAGEIDHQGNRWDLQPLTGTLMGGSVAGSLRLDEGPPRAPDEIALDLEADRLDAKPLLGHGGGGDWQALPLTVAEQRGTHLQGRIAVDELVLGSISLRDAVLRGRFASGLIELSELGFSHAGGRIQVIAALRAADAATGRLTLRLDASALDAAQLAASASLQSARLSGQATAGVTLDATGATLGAALRAGRGQAVLVMTEGRIARSALEAASTNILALFRDQDGTARIRCLLAAADLRNGRTAIAPLRLRTTEATISGGGSIDLAQGRLDLLLGSESASTGFFALDIPVRISGALRDPDIGPSRGTPPRRSSLPDGFPAEQRALAERSGCLR